jgi:membrane protease YdiL (CAAX protease family)
MHGANAGLSVLALANLALFGLFAGCYALREGGLWGVCAVHSAWNWAQGSLFGFEVSGHAPQWSVLVRLRAQGPDWLTGGAFGPEGGAAVTAMLVLGLAAVLLWPRSGFRRRDQSGRVAAAASEATSSGGVSSSSFSTMT